jgi:N-acetyl-gamma-glutamyl-phosphate reductase
MTVYVQLQPQFLLHHPNIKQIKSAYKEYYTSGEVKFVDKEFDYLPANGLRGRDDMEIYVQGTDERILLTASFDNLGKGASGAAIQNLLLMTGEK